MQIAVPLAVLGINKVGFAVLLERLILGSLGFFPKQ
jgi:hypothetical protein